LPINKRGKANLQVLAGFLAINFINSYTRIVALIFSGWFYVTQAAGVLSIRSIGFNISMPPTRALRANLSPAEVRDRFFGMFVAAFTAGDIISPIIGTYLYDIYRFKNIELGGFILPGYGIPFYVNSILGIASTILLLALVKEPNHKERLNHYFLLPNPKLD